LQGLWTRAVLATKAGCQGEPARSAGEVAARLARGNVRIRSKVPKIIFD
jgi:hypothetical protein